MILPTIEFTSGHRLIDNGVGDYDLHCPEHGNVGFSHMGEVVSIQLPGSRCGFCRELFGERRIFLPLKTVGGLNAHEHWRLRWARAKNERQTAALLVPKHSLPCTVIMTRLSPGTLDGDNLQGACKSVRDGIADKLGIDDNDPRVNWLYAQRRCKRGEHGVEVVIRP